MVHTRILKEGQQRTTVTVFLAMLAVDFSSWVFFKLEEGECRIEQILERRETEKTPSVAMTE